MDTNKRNELISRMVADGHSLSDVQKVLQQEHGVNITYMELRMLAAELQVNWEKLDAARQPQAPKKDEAVGDADADAVEGTKVTISKLVRPGALYSGDVRFASGITAEWYLDQQGRLGLANETGRPNENDVMEFQQELQRLLQGRMG